MSVRAVIVGEAWGRKEDMFKHPFVGWSGRELALMCAESGLTQSPRVGYDPHGKWRPSELDMIKHWENIRNEHDIHLDNVFNLHPVNNDIKALFDNASGDRTLPQFEKGRYVRAEYRHHVEGLWERLATAQPNLIIAFGNTACWAVLGQTKISALRGTVQTSPRLGFKVLPSYHPAALRDWSLRVIIKADLTKASREIEFPEIRRPERWITTHDYQNNVKLTIPEIREWLAQPTYQDAVDIESGYALYSKLELKKMTSYMRHLLAEQIAIVGFASSPSCALAIPILDRAAPDLCYWLPHEEAEVWRLIRIRLARKVPKIFQNGNYDIGRFMSCGLVPQMCEHDTMLRHHALYPELLKSLGFLGSIYANEVSWKQMYSNRESLKRDE